MKKIIDKLKDSVFILLILIGISILTYSYVYSNNSEEGSHIDAQDVFDIKDQQISANKQISTNISNQYTGETQNTDIKLNLSLATDEDKKLISIIKESNNIFMGHIKDIQKAAKENNHKSIETLGISIRKDSQKYLNMSNNINISSSFNILFDEYKKSLNNFNNAGRLIEYGSRIPGSGNLIDSITYLKEGTIHMEMAINSISG